MTYNVLSGTLNPIHSLTHSLSKDISGIVGPSEPALGFLCCQKTCKEASDGDVLAVGPIIMYAINTVCIKTVVLTRNSLLTF